MSIQIATNNEIVIDGKATGYGVMQAASGTIVSKGREVLALPANRYNLTTDAYLNPGVAGVTQFEADVRAALQALAA
jgi:formylmethanofuran dehydrogenase subunit C